MGNTAKRKEESLGADRKALLINLDGGIYGTLAEIGAGQEVARHFFKVGGAAGTIAKSMSAYDMKISDEIYGKAGRYVSRERLSSMLQHEYSLLLERLSSQRGAETKFFAFADTVSARNFKGTNECHGWMGIRFQAEPLSPPNDIILHVRMTDRENLQQQQALGVFGVNLIFGAYTYGFDPELLISSLLDGLSIERIEVDMIEFSGPFFKDIDNRLMSLKLVHKGLTNACLFAPDRTVLQPSEILRKKPILVMRGSFRPTTYVNLDMMRCALDQFKKLPSIKDDAEPVALFEITLHNLLASGQLDDTDFIARADTLSTLGYPVLISNYSEHYRLTAYFRRYSQETIGMAMGINTLFEIFGEHYYESLEGGMLEALGRLFQKEVKLLIYPMSREGYLKFLGQVRPELVAEEEKVLPDIVSVEDIHVRKHLRHLYNYLRELGCLEPLSGYNSEYLSINSREVLAMIQQGKAGWDKLVPPSAAAFIKQRKLFGLKE